MALDDERRPAASSLQLLMAPRLVRYGFAGGLSFLTHLIVLVALVEAGDIDPVLATMCGFLASVVVSYLLQHWWVFLADVPMREAFPRFLLVTAVGLAINSLIMGLGIRVANLHYLLVQIVAFVAVPVSNYLLNRSWTFVPSRSRASIPLPDLGYLLFATALWLGLGVCAVVHLDFARDMMIAADILDGVLFPRAGPELAGSLNLGPVWFYLLALLQLFGGFWPVVSLLALLGAVQFWLVYVSTCRIANRPAAFTCIGLLLLPAWTTFELVLVAHPLLTASLVAGMILAGLRFADGGRIAPLTLMLLCFVLGLHAHPTVLVLIALPVGFAWMGIARHGLNRSGLAMACGVAALPLLPMLVDQVASGWPILAGWAVFSGHEQSSGRLAAIGPLLWQMALGGPEYWLTRVGGWSTPLARGVSLLLALFVAAGIAGAVRRVARGDRVMLILLVGLVVGLVGLSQVRAFYPYYMLSGVRVVLMMVAGIGVHHLWPRSRALRRLALLPAVVGPVLLVAVTVPLAVQQRAGAWPFAFLPMMDVVSPAGEHRPHPFLAMPSVRASGEWLCDNEEKVLHGSYALSVMHSYAAEARLHCGASRFRVGGGDEGSQHLIGLSITLLEKLSIEPEVRIGGFGLVPVAIAPNRIEPWVVGPDRRYPPLTPDFEGSERRFVPWPSGPRGPLVVTDFSFGVSGPPQVRADCNGEALAPLAADNVTWIFDARGCASGGVNIESAVPDYLDVVILRRVPAD